MPPSGKASTADPPLATTTFLFTDIVGSTRQWEESPGMHERVQAHFKVLTSSVENRGGVVFATLGDGIAAAFRSAEGALRAAVDAQLGLPAVGLSARMGIHTGEAERVGPDYRGRPVNRAARIMAAASGGQILVSHLTASLLRSGRDATPLLDVGTHRLRDLDEPEHLWQVLHPALPEDFPRVRGLGGQAHNLPAQRSSLIGRESDLARLVDTAELHRVITLTGTGGVGKTRLAVEAAATLLDRFAEVWFVELSGVSDPSDVDVAVAHALDLGAVVEPVAAILQRVARDRTLLVLDSCEHVVDGVASLIDEVTRSVPSVAVLATSREPLGLAGEQVVPVRPLDPATSAAELFRQRAASAGADLTTAAPELVAEVCARVDGIPLAIELAAARVASLGLPAVVDGLDGLLAGPAGRRAGVEERHLTMRATVEWSYRLLDSHGQRVLNWLAVHPNGFELDTAAHLGAHLGLGEDAARDHVAALVHRSMLVAEPSGGGGGVRHRMLEPIRTFALERVTERGERHAALTALAEWVATLTDLPFADCCSASVHRSAIRLEREVESWREAVGHASRSGDGALAARLCGPPVAFFLLGRNDLAAAVRPLLELCGSDPFRRRAVLCALSVSASGESDVAPLLAWADEIQRCDAVEPTGLGALMRWLALAWHGDFAEAIEVCVQASEDERIARSTRDLLVGIATLDHHSLTDATSDPHGLVARALEVADRSDVPFNRATCRLGAAWGLAETDAERALELVRRALSDIEGVPALTRLTLPGSASRLLTRIDPRTAARCMLEQLDAVTAGSSSFVDQIPLLYAAELVDQLGHGTSGDGPATVASQRPAPYRSMMDFVALARQASSVHLRPDPDLQELELTVRAALTSVATPMEGAP